MLLLQNEDVSRQKKKIRYTGLSGGESCGYLFLFYFFNYNGLQSWCTENCVNKLLARVKCIILPILSQSHNRNLKIKNLNPLSNPIKTLSAKFVGNIKQFVGASFKGVEKWCIENKLVH